MSRVVTFVTASRKPSVWSIAGVGPRRASDVLWNRPGRPCSSCGHLCRENCEWCQARRSPHRAGEQIHFRDQPQHRESARRNRASDLAGARRRGDRIERRLAAVHESFRGTYETCRRTLKTSAYWGRSEVTGARSYDEIDPLRTHRTTDRIAFRMGPKYGKAQ